VLLLCLQERMQCGKCGANMEKLYGKRKCNECSDCHEGTYLNCKGCNYDRCLSCLSRGLPEADS
jgi:hypothetical protein